MANIFWVGATLPKTEKNRGWKIPDCDVQMICQIIITFDTTPCQIWSQIVHVRTPSFNSLVMELASQYLSKANTGKIPQPERSYALNYIGEITNGQINLTAYSLNFDVSTRNLVSWDCQILRYYITWMLTKMQSK